MAKKRKFGKTAAIVTAVIAGASILGVWGISSVASRLSSVGRPNVQSVEVSAGVIESTVAGTGTLEYQDPENITVPAGLDIEAVLVGQGRQAEAGELLAAVGPSSCEARMSEIYAQIADTDSQLADLPEDTQVVEVKAPVSGTVAAVNAAPGASVLDTLASTGALAVLSGSGSGISARVQTDSAKEVFPGETVVISAGDGRNITATVRSTEDGSFTAELTDASIGAGTSVSAATPSGETLGEGVTVPFDTTNVVGPAGTVESVKVTAGSKVSAGDVVLTVRASGKSAERIELEQRRSSLTAQYDQLAAIAKNGGITSPAAGTIVACDVSAGQNTSELGTASSVSSAGGGTVRIPSSAGDVLSMFGAGMSVGNAPKSPSLMLSSSADTPDADDLPSESPLEVPESQSPAVEIPTAQPNPATESAPEISAPPLRVIPRVEVPLVPPIPVLPLQTELAVLPVYTGTVRWTPDDVQAQFETVYKAEVTLHAEDGFIFAEDCSAAVLCGTAEDVRADGNTLSFTVVYEKTAPQLSLPDIDWDAIQDFLNAGGSLDISGLRDLLQSGIISPSGLGFDLSDLTSQIDPSALYGQVDPSVLAGALGGSSIPSIDPSILAGTGSTYQDISDVLAASQPVAFKIAPDNGMQLTIGINQMDILSVSAGMPCQVTVDAIPGTEFSGTVENVSQIVSSDGDYTATITLPKDERMRSGMTASATIVTQETSDILTIPVAAIQEDGNRVFVYTGYDAGKDEFTDPADVETGVSNGNDVEILSGLESGQVVYFKGADALQTMMDMMRGDAPDDSPQSTYVPPDQAIATP